MSQSIANLQLGIETLVQMGKNGSQFAVDVTELCTEYFERLPPEFSVAMIVLVSDYMNKQAQLVADAQLTTRSPQ